VDKFISKCYVDGFNIKKYGLLGDDSEKIGGIEEKQVEIEVIKEIRVEVPVEIIKEVEVIKEVVKYVEVPVEIIKEVEVIQYVDKEVIKEVPVEIIKEKIVNVIQEVPVPNIDKIGDETKSNDKVLLLQETLQKLRKELTDKNSRITELEEINKQLESIKVSQGAVYLKGSNLNERM
jgi:predicted DNA binding CopG/RHH family protein